ncbi:MAG: hypothetical protein U1B82_19025 [Cypionkella sp.]|nr:hypothetical protein [Cypionkella sp.]
MLGQAGNDEIHLGEGNDINWVDREVWQTGFDNGQLGDDTVFGEAGNDSIWDYSGANILDGGEGSDAIYATDNQLDGWEDTTQASDQISGGAGNDILIGDDGDTLIGGAGDDLLVSIHERDDAEAIIISDFDGSEDRLELDVYQSFADLSQWTLFSRTDDESGTVIVGLENNTDPGQIIELAHLTTASNFALSQVLLHQI